MSDTLLKKSNALNVLRQVQQNCFIEIEKTKRDMDVILALAENVFLTEMEHIKKAEVEDKKEEAQLAYRQQHLDDELFTEVDTATENIQRRRQNAT